MRGGAGCATVGPVGRAELRACTGPGPEAALLRLLGRSGIGFVPGPGLGAGAAAGVGVGQAACGLLLSRPSSKWGKAAEPCWVLRGS